MFQSLTSSVNIETARYIRLKLQLLATMEEWNHTMPTLPSIMLITPLVIVIAGKSKMIIELILQPLQFRLIGQQP